MPRHTRITIPNYPHHITQRGSRNMQVFFSDFDRENYLHMLKKFSAKYGVEIISYCLMTNHVHLILVPHQEDSLSNTLKYTHMRFAAMINYINGWSGHLWQQRFYSSVMDENYFWNSVRYVEQNPVKAGICKNPEDYQWSSTKEYLNVSSFNLVDKENKWSKKILEVTNLKEQIKQPLKAEYMREIKDKLNSNKPLCHKRLLEEYTTGVTKGVRHN